MTASTKQQNTVKKSPAKVANEQPRMLPKRSYKSFRLQKTIRRPKQQKLPSSRTLLRDTTRLLLTRKWFFIGVVAVYGVLQLILVSGVMSSDTTEIRDTLRGTVDGVMGALAASFTLTTYVTSTTGQPGTEQASVYQFVLILIACLAVIWALRRVESLRGTKLGADEKLRIRDAYYKGMAPLVPFVLVLVVILLEFIPLLIGSWLYSAVISGGIAVSLTEQIIWGVLLSAFGVLTIYMVLSSIFALLIVTLPDMAPLQALRSSRALVLYRRWELIRKFVVYVLVAAAVLLIIVMPIAYWIPVIAPWVVYMLLTIMLAFSLAYLYVIYRELLRRDQ